jgi:multicomponent Na+:H+ antiporter subunit F
MTPLLPGPVLAAAGLLVGGAFALSIFRVVRGPTSADRVVALDLMASLTVGAIALHTLATGSQAFLRVATVLALIGFLGTVAFASYLARSRG